MEKEIQWLLAEKYQGKLTPAAKKDIARLKRGEHVDYVIGFVEFAGCVIDLSQKPLIPRPETEHWVLKAVEEMQQDQRKSIRCLDMFAGSGCVGVAILTHVPDARVDFAEQEQKLLKQIRLNIKKNSIDPKRARVIHSDIFSHIRGKYDHIFANPPYVASSRWKYVQPSVAKQEPREALTAGKDGLQYIRPFLKQAKNFLSRDGKIYLEFDSPQKKDVEKLLQQYGYSTWQFHKDQYGKWRFVVIQT